MRILIIVCGVSLGEAKEIVHFSSVWSDLREETNKFHQDLLDAASTIEGVTVIEDDDNRFDLTIDLGNDDRKQSGSETD